MAPKGGTFFILLIVACAALAEHPDVKPGNAADCRSMVRKLMMKCQEKGYPLPEMRLLTTVFSKSNMPMEKNDDKSNTLLATFLDAMKSVTPVGASKDLPKRVPWAKPDKMKFKLWNCTKLSTMIKKMRNSSEASACYMQAFMAPQCWATLETQDEDLDSEDYDAILWAAKPALQHMRAKRLRLSPKVKGRNMEMLMKMLREEYNNISEVNRRQVMEWEKERIAQSFFNCTQSPSSDSKSMQIKRCKRSLQWLNLRALTMMGPFISYLPPEDVNSSPKEKLCEFFRSAQLKSTMRGVDKMNPRLCKKFVQRVQECFRKKEEFEEHVDKLGTLACYYNDTPEFTPNVSRKLLSQLDDCSNPGSTKLKKHLLKVVMPTLKSMDAQELRKLGRSLVLLSPKQLSTIPSRELKEVLKDLGPNVRWRKAQLRALVKKELGDEKCKGVTGKELRALAPIVEGVPSCVFKRLKDREILNDEEALKTISERMKKGQKMAMVERLNEDVEASVLVKKLPGPFIGSISLEKLKKANVTSLDMVGDNNWTQSQAAYLAKKFHDLKKPRYSRLRSVLQGITCKMLSKTADNDTQDMVQAILENQRWVSKMQVGCAARRYFAALEKEKPDYFKRGGLADVPTDLIVHLQPSKLMSLPDTVCDVFLKKMESASLSSLPLRSPSRPALVQRALRCLTIGRNLSELTNDDVLRLGPLLCELPPSQLRLLAPGVLNSSLENMASCQYIPRRHRAAITQLVQQIFGDPSDWSPQTMESLGPLLFLDDDTVPALPNKPWMKDVLCFLKMRMSRASNALRKKLFDFIVSTGASNEGRRKREAVDDDNSNNGQGDDGSNAGGKDNKQSDPVNNNKPTVELIEELGADNLYWTASQLKSMSADTFEDTVEILGAIPEYNQDQMTELAKKAVEAFGPVSQMNESVVAWMGCIPRGFLDSELEDLPFSLDNLEDIARCGWNKSQTQAVWKAVAKHDNLTVQQLGAAEMVMLSQFICGLNSSDIAQLNKDSFRDALGSINDIQCSINLTRQLKDIAVSSLGQPSTWNEAEVSNLGNVIAGLDADEFTLLDASVLSFLAESAIPLIPPANLAALSAAKIGALGPANAAMVTNEQRAGLSADQLGALASAEAGSGDERKNTESPSGSPTSLAPPGAPSVSVEGIAAFIKPVLVLLMGFLLL